VLPSVVGVIASYLSDDVVEIKSDDAPTSMSSVPGRSVG